MIKRIITSTIIVSSVIICLIVLIESIISKHFSFIYAITYIIGAIVSIFNLYLTSRAITKYQNYYTDNARGLFVSNNILKLFIILFTFLIVGIGIERYSIISCAFGMVVPRYLIYYLYLIFDKVKLKKMSIDDLGVNEDIKNKLIENGFNKVLDICNVKEDSLISIFTKDEISEIKKCLKEKELSFKKDLEVVIDNDDTFED